MHGLVDPAYYERFAAEVKMAIAHWPAHLRAEFWTLTGYCYHCGETDCNGMCTNYDSVLDND